MATEIASAYIALYARMPGVQNDIKQQLDGVDAEVSGAKIGTGIGVGISGKSAAIAGAVGGLVYAAASVGISALSGLVGEAVATSDGVDKFRKTLEFAGLDTSAIDAAAKQTRSYADKTVYDLTTIQNTTAQLAANGVSDYADLTEAAGNLNAVAGGNADTFGSVAMTLTQTAGAGKLTTENWNQLADAIPGASGVLQTALLDAGAYTGNFRTAMEKGMITADEFNAAVMEVGTDPIAVEAAASTDTFEGAIGNLQATIVGGLSDAFTDMKPALTGFIEGIAGFVGFIQDNIGWIGPLAAGIGIVVAAVVLWTAVQWLLNVALTANPVGLIIVAIGLLIGAIILLVQNWDTVVAFLGDVWNGFVGWFMGVMDGFVGWWNGVWAGFSGFLSDIWNGIVSFVTAYINTVLLIITVVITAISAVWNAIWTNVGNFFIGIWNGIVGAVQMIQGVFSNVFNAIGGIITGAFNGVVSTVRGVINGIIDLVNGAIGGINDLIGTAGAAIGITVKIPRIPRLANGALISASRGGSLVNVGEGRYDEAVIPLGGPQAEKIRGALGGGGSTWNIYEATSPMATAIEVARRQNMMASV